MGTCGHWTEDKPVSVVVVGEEPGEHRGSGWAVGERGSECSQLSYAETDGVVAGCRGDHRTMVGTFSGEKSQSLFLGSSQ